MDKKEELCKYRFEQSKETIGVAMLCLDNGEVKVYIETPDEEDGFHHITCYLPPYRIEDEFGYNEDEIESFLDIIKRNEKRIMEASHK